MSTRKKISDIQLQPIEPRKISREEALQRAVRIFRLLLPYRRRLLWLFAVSIAFGGVSASFIFLTDWAIEILRRDQVPAELARWVGEDLKPRYVYFSLLVGAALAVAMKCFFQYFRRYLQSWLTQKVVVDMQNRLAEHLLGLDVAYFQQERAGDLLSRMTNDLHALALSVKLLNVLITRPITLVLMLGVVLWRNPWLALAGLLGAPVAGFVISTLSRKMRKAARMAQEKQADLTSVMVQFLAGMHTVKAFCCEDFERDQFHQENEQYFNVCMKRERARSRVRPTVEFTTAVGCVLAMALGGEWVFNGTLQLENLIAFLAALGLMYQPAKEISNANSELQTAIPGAERVFEILDLTPHVKEGSQRLASFEREIRFDDVSFGYVENCPVLSRVDLTIKKGECVALVGPSGAGKTTLTDLILRFYDPTAGAVLLDGVDLRTLGFDNLRGHMALVSQTPFLFHCSVRDNIAYGRADADPKAIEFAAKAANIHEDIMALPKGYDTLVGERGETLSGGQRQRLTIARAIFKNAPILILDEATSSLDSKSERQVQEALDRLMQNRTSIVIAHRLSTVRHADRIVVIDGGRIVSQGTHEELLSSCPIYSNLVQLQSGSQEDGCAVRAGQFEAPAGCPLPEPPLEEIPIDA